MDVQESYDKMDGVGKKTSNNFIFGLVVCKCPQEDSTTVVNNLVRSINGPSD